MELPPTEAEAPAKQEKQKFRPSKKPIKADAPTRQNTKTGPRRPAAEAKLDDFKPQAKSTTFTTPKNDPADLDDFLVLGLAGFNLRKRVNRLALDHSGYLDLVDECYHKYLSSEKYFDRSISQGMFRYYCGALLHQRILNVCEYQGDLNDNSAVIFNNKLGEKITIPKPIAIYLNQIGSFTDNNKRPWYIQRPNLTGGLVVGLLGHFGRVGGNTHYLYSSYPAPAILALNCWAEIAQSEPNWVRNWRLPYALRPNAIDNPDHPNENLLGWSRTSAIRPEVRALYDDFGIAPVWNVPGAGGLPTWRGASTFGTNVSNFPVNSDLLFHISNRLLETKQPYVIGPNLSGVGSQSLIPFSEIIGEAEGRRRTSTGAIDVYSYTQLTTQRGTAAAVTRLRARRIDVLANYCYQFAPPAPGAPIAQPAGWIVTLNDWYNQRESNLLDFRIFGLNRIEGREASKAFVANVASR